MKIIWLFAAVVAVVGAATLRESLPAESGKVRYDNYAVYKVHIKHKAQLWVVDLIKNLTEKYDMWKEFDEVSKEVHIMVSPDEAKLFNKMLKLYGVEVEVMIPNVQQLIDEEQYDERISDDGAFGWTRYYPLHEIEAWLDGILAAYPSVTEGFVIGKSHEGRNIRGIRISYKAGNPGIFIESNIHAREWITSATATWFINQLLTSEKAEVRNLAENYDWYIVPVFNVDGFVYSHEHNRMWRKTRTSVSNSPCIGTDANRNFDSHWMENNGASDNPCDETFAGPSPFSEPEARALADYVTSIKDKINMYLSFHSYGQLLLSPYGHTTEEVPENYDHILEIGKAFAEAIVGLPYKTDYVYGSTAIALYIASGSSVDWVFNTLNVKLGYTIEYRDKGRFGFILPPVQILPNCEELMTGLLALVDKSNDLGYFSV